MIDIRSDTVTKPTEAMRRAMAQAEVGDDVYGDDPTVNRLEALGAEMLGKEASLFVPSGTFGNELALFTWCPRGTEVVLGEECHIIVHEAGAAAAIAGVQTRCIPAPDGVLQAEEIKRRLRRQDLHAPATSLICLENAHSSGRVVSLARMDAVKAIAAEWGLPVHLDGARIFNAAAALGCTAADIAARADSVMCCLSKGLCAPIGSLLAGPKNFVEAARLKRKIMGGGMRQAGILAAAGIIALTGHTSLLAADHARAKKLAQGLANIEGIHVDPDALDINMVFFSHEAGEQAGETVGQFRKRGILINPPEGGLFRFVTHYWIGDAELDAILAAAVEIFAGTRGGK
ncbi:MAG: aminotransferase class I/II-fold pyridoxal phosphate-dependent enzyme [Treponema sp.]|jgi:threonine aldolase|nr:aminotransferase class I/II-fold pyridoxal phosphate-dependent enzyme [Treponema sp.]